MLEMRIEILLDAKVIYFHIRSAHSNTYMPTGEDCTGPTLPTRTLLCSVFRDKVVDRVIQAVRPSLDFKMLATNTCVLQPFLASPHYFMAFATRQKGRAPLSCCRDR